MFTMNCYCCAPGASRPPQSKSMLRYAFSAYPSLKKGGEVLCGIASPRPVHKPQVARLAMTHGLIQRMQKILQFRFRFKIDLAGFAAVGWAYYTGCFQLVHNAARTVIAEVEAALQVGCRA